MHTYAVTSNIQRVYRFLHLSYKRMNRIIENNIAQYGAKVNTFANRMYLS